MAWYDTLINGLNTAGNIYDAARPFIDVGASIYDRNQTRGAISDAFNAYRGYADQSLNTLGDIYQQGTEATAPYREAGTNAVSGYRNLLNDPNQIYNDPGYLWRFDQGAEAIDRNMAAGGYRGSGNRDIALTEYGQNYATAELDKALARYLPMVQAGLEGTRGYLDAGRTYAEGVGQINRGLGEAAAGAAIGQAGASSRMITDLLGIGSGAGSAGNPFSALAGGAGALRDLYTGVTGAGTAGATGAGAAGVAGAAPGVTVGTATPPPTFTGTPIGGSAGPTVPSTGGLPSAASGWNPFTNGVLGGNQAALGVTPAGLGTSGTVSTLGQFGSSLGVGGAVMGAAALLGSLGRGTPSQDLYKAAMQTQDPIGALLDIISTRGAPPKLNWLGGYGQLDDTQANPYKGTLGEGYWDLWRQGTEARGLNDPGVTGGMERQLARYNPKTFAQQAFKIMQRSLPPEYIDAYLRGPRGAELARLMGVARPMAGIPSNEYDNTSGLPNALAV